MSAAGKLRQIRARGVAQIEQMNVVGDFFSAFDAEFTHGSDRLPFRRFGLIDLGPGGTPLDSLKMAAPDAGCLDA
jgi:hypothetical protein